MKNTLRTMFVIAIVALMGVTISEASDNSRFEVNYSHGTVLDTKTNLMWAAKDNGSDISWTSAKVYCENYFAGGYRDWRLPTKDELASLYDAKNTREAPCAGNFSIHMTTNLIETSCFSVWSSETRGSDAAQFNFVYGTPFWYLQSHTYGIRVLPVRLAK